MSGGNYLCVKKYLFSRKKIFLFMIINIFLHENKLEREFRFTEKMLLSERQNIVENEII